jgi:aminopeptidase N
MRFRIAILSGLLVAGSALQAQDIQAYYTDPGAHETDRNIDVTHMKLEVSFKPSEGLVTGKVRHQFRLLQAQIDTIFLDGPGIRMKAAKAWQISSSTGRRGTIQTETPVNASWRNTPEGIVMVFNGMSGVGKEYAMELEYEANPRRGIYFVGWKLPEIPDPVHMTRRQIWTQGQGIDNRHWIPMIDQRSDKFITEVIVHFDKTYNVLSNGALLSNKENIDGTRTWHYRMPHPHAGYLLMLAIDNYAVKRTATKRGTPIQFWYYPEHPEKLEPSSRCSEAIIEILEDETGIPYPWGSYAQVMVQEFLYGAMENTSATVFGDFFWIDERGYLDRNYVGVNAHEAAHQWFGDLITARTDADQWLQESFATYYPTLVFRRLMGEDEMKWQQRGNMNGAIAAGEKNSLPVRHSNAGTARHYPKGASVLSMLSYVLGEENYRRSIKLYLERHGFQTVETSDLQKAIMDATGINTDWFFDQWIWRGGEPHYRVSTLNSGKNLVFTVEQIHKQEPTVGIFKMPVWFAVHYTDGSSDRMQVMVDKAFQQITMPLTDGKTVAFSLFDEGSHILKKVTFNKSLDQLKAQAANAQFMLDRYDAVVFMGKMGEATGNINFLKERFAKEKHRGIRAEIARQLVALAGNDDALIRSLLQDRETDVRRITVENLKASTLTAPWLEIALQDSSYGIVENALVKLMDWQTDQAKRGAYLEKTKGLYGNQHGLHVRWLEYASKHFPEQRGTLEGLITDYAGELYEFRTRVNAFEALRRMNLFNATICRNLFNATLSFNSRLSGPAKDVLSYFRQQSAAKKIMAEVIAGEGWTEAQRKTLREIAGA